MTSDLDDPGSRDGGPDGDLPATPDTTGEAAVRTMLRELPELRMPSTVYDRVQRAVTTEARLRFASAETNTLRKRRLRPGGIRRGSIWAVASGAVAAAAVIAIAVVFVGQQSPATTPPRAAVVAMNTSGTTYTRTNLAKQVGAQWRSMRAQSLAPHVTAADPSHSTPDVVLTAPSNSPLASELVAASFTRSQDEVTQCLRRVAPNSNPVMIDLASYIQGVEPAAAPAAVLAFGAPDADTLDVYVVDRLCGTDGAHAMAHVTATSASQ